jgi:uroporphyrin-III C-methyltransferase / precorrin-2 dehydrogenase / sirohydrochlorin ferrochelatase
MPLNVVDVPEQCDFFTPSIIERAPVHRHFVRGRRAGAGAAGLRAKIEAALSPNLGRLAALRALCARRATALIRSNTGRRRYFEALVTAPTVEAALEHGQGPRGRGDAARGACCGDAGGRHRLADRGGAGGRGPADSARAAAAAGGRRHRPRPTRPDAVVEMGRRDAERISVGKKKGHHSFTQAQINALIVRLARRAGASPGSRAATRWCSAAPARRSPRSARRASPTRSCPA